MNLDNRHHDKFSHSMSRKSIMWSYNSGAKWKSRICEKIETWLNLIKLLIQAKKKCTYPSLLQYLSTDPQITRCVCWVRILRFVIMDYFCYVYSQYWIGDLQFFKKFSHYQHHPMHIWKCINVFLKMFFLYNGNYF